MSHQLWGGDVRHRQLKVRWGKIVVGGLIVLHKQKKRYFTIWPPLFFSSGSRRERASQITWLTALFLLFNIYTMRPRWCQYPFLNNIYNKTNHIADSSCSKCAFCSWFLKSKNVILKFQKNAIWLSKLGGGWSIGKFPKNNLFWFSLSHYLFQQWVITQLFSTFTLCVNDCDNIYFSTLFVPAAANYYTILLQE